MTFWKFVSYPVIKQNTSAEQNGGRFVELDCQQIYLRSTSIVRFFPGHKENYPFISWFTFLPTCFEQVLLHSRTVSCLNEKSEKPEFVSLLTEIDNVKSGWRIPFLFRQFSIVMLGDASGKQSLTIRTVWKTQQVLQQYISFFTPSEWTSAKAFYIIIVLNHVYCSTCFRGRLKKTGRSAGGWCHQPS